MPIWSVVNKGTSPGKTSAKNVSGDGIVCPKSIVVSRQCRDINAKRLFLYSAIEVTDKSYRLLPVFATLTISDHYPSHCF
jgi:hypothetical protein